MLAVLALVAVSCSSSTHKVGSASATTAAISPSTSTTVSGFKVGDVATAGGWDIAVVGVHNPLATSSAEFTTAAGRHFLGLDLTLKNTTTAPQSLDLSTLHIDDAGGHSYEAFPMPGATSFNANNVAAGTTRRGTLPFDVDDAATPPLTLVFSPNPSGSPVRIGLT